MAKEKISQLLEKLQNEIAKQTSLPADKKAEMTQLIEDIEQGIDDDSISDELSDSLAAAVSEFEASHPRLTAIINDIMVTLANMGI